MPGCPPSPGETPPDRRAVPRAGRESPTGSSHIGASTGACRRPQRLQQAVLQTAPLCGFGSLPQHAELVVLRGWIGDQVCPRTGKYSAFRAPRLVCGITNRSPTVMKSRDCLASQKLLRQVACSRCRRCPAGGNRNHGTHGRRRMMLVLGVV